MNNSFNHKQQEQLKSLSSEELQKVTGGESGWYYLGQLFGLAKDGGSGAYHDAMSSSNYGGIR